MNLPNPKNIDKDRFVNEVLAVVNDQLVLPMNMGVDMSYERLKMAFWCWSIPRQSLKRYCRLRLKKLTGLDDFDSGSFGLVILMTSRGFPVNTPETYQWDYE